MSKAGLLGTVAYQLGANEPLQFALEGSIAIGGMAVAWLRDQMGLIQSSDECEAIAQQVPDTGVQSSSKALPAGRIADLEVCVP